MFRPGEAMLSCRVSTAHSASSSAPGPRAGPIESLRDCSRGSSSLLGPPCVTARVDTKPGVSATSRTRRLTGVFPRAGDSAARGSNVLSNRGKRQRPCRYRQRGHRTAFWPVDDRSERVGVNRLPLLQSMTPSRAGRAQAPGAWRPCVTSCDFNHGPCCCAVAQCRRWRRSAYSSC